MVPEQAQVENSLLREKYRIDPVMIILWPKKQVSRHDITGHLKRYELIRGSACGKDQW